MFLFRGVGAAEDLLLGVLAWESYRVGHVVVDKWFLVLLSGETHRYVIVYRVLVLQFWMDFVYSRICSPGSIRRPQVVAISNISKRHVAMSPAIDPDRLDDIPAAEFSRLVEGWSWRHWRKCETVLEECCPECAGVVPCPWGVDGEFELGLVGRGELDVGSAG